MPTPGTFQEDAPSSDKEVVRNDGEEDVDGDGDDDDDEEEEDSSEGGEGEDEDNQDDPKYEG